MNKSGFIIVTNDSFLYGLQDKDGNVIVPCQYDRILDFDDDGYIRLLKGKIYGTINLEGKEVIPHSLGITHLGVFHNGTARAKKGDCWGLVDEKGLEVTEFCFKWMNAHSSEGYSCAKQDGTVGYLSEDGTFHTTSKRFKYKSPYSKRGAFHDGIAPAYDENLRRWVFIDKNDNRINDYAYWSMDPVLRFGAYEVAMDSHHYNYVRFDGKPIFEEWFDYVSKVDKQGQGKVRKLCLDSDGNEITLNNGQPLYLYGLVSMDGTFLIPPRYWNLYYTDYYKAEDWETIYYYKPDGNKLIRSWFDDECPDKPYDSKVQEPLNIPKEWQREHLRKMLPPYDNEIPTPPVKMFNKAAFKFSLERWISSCIDNKMEFYYRDTDADIDVKKIYKRGRIFRMGKLTEFTQKLRRPIHKIRFLVVSSHMGNNAWLDNLTIRRLKGCLPEEEQGYNFNLFNEYALIPNSYVAVIDVQEYAGKTQVTLAHIPMHAVPLMQKYGINIQNVKVYTRDFENIKKISKSNFIASFSEPIHGHSLSKEWNEIMYHPIGLDDNNKPLPLERVSYEHESHPMQVYYSWMEQFMEEEPYKWKEDKWMEIVEESE